MRLHARILAVGLLTLLGLPAFGAGRPNFDALGARPPVPGAAAALLQKAEIAVSPGARVQAESRLGVPTFLWVAGSRGASLAAAQGNGPTFAKSPQEAAARAALAQFASLYGLSAPDVASAAVAMVHDTGRGAIVVKLLQKVGGIEIFHEEVNVVLNRQLEAVAISGYVSSAATPPAQGGAMSFALRPAEAAAAAIRDLTLAAATAGQLTSTGSEGGYEKFAAAGPAGALLDDTVRVKPVYFHLPEGLEAGYYVEVIGRTGESAPGTLDATGAGGPTEGYGYVISAVNGALLFRKDLSADAFTYRVWADPTTKIPYDTPAGNSPHPKVVPSPDGAQAAFVAPQDVALDNAPFSRNDPWLAPGATETNGNNADAFLNLFSPDGYGNPTTTSPADPPNGDYRAQITSAGQFLHTHVPDTTSSTAEARQASIQQLFYNVNFLHDWYYDSGFDEASRNAQTNNFGRGGLGNDNIKAQVQDFSGFSNANMLTPADGSRPRMRMYVFPNLANNFEVQAPAGIAGKMSMGISMSGPQNFDVTADALMSTFSASPTCAVTNAAALAGKVALFDFDNTDGTGCTFSTRIARLTTTTTASAIILVYTSGSPNTIASITGFVTTNTTPVATLSWNEAAPIKTQLAVPNTVTVRVYRAADRDGTLDNQIVFHEWAHYLSNRLIGNGSGLGAQQSAGMGEGWSDFSSMILTARADDTSVPSNATWNGTYALATYATSGFPFNGSANQGYYFGIRRYPYSTDMTKNPLTFIDIQEGVPLPVGPPVAFGASGVGNSEVHNTGEVWTTMLWECYASLLRDTLGATPRLTFQQAQDRMKGYLVASLKATPVFPTFTEARDAVLAAAYANDIVDYVEFQQAFARRGAGFGAVSPDRFSTTNTPVTESFVTGPALVYTASVLDDSVASCDADGVLDSGETGRLTVALTNVGTTTLTATTATVTSPTAGVTFPAGNTINFPTSAPTALTIGSVVVALAPGIGGIQQIDFQIDYNDPQLGGPPLTATPGFRGNTNEIPAVSATDDVEAAGTLWAVSSNPTFGAVAPWARRAVTPLQHAWHVDDPNAGADEYLASPVFTVDGGGSFNLQFDHSWSFEFDAGGNYDGGVVEMSVNGGAFGDIGGPAYNGTILNYSGDVNPLKGRTGFVQTSAGTVHTSLTQAVAPGSTVQVRFRMGADGGGSAGGWDVDNVAFTGVVETPFTAVVADPGCSLPTTTVLAPDANPSPFGNTLTLTATVATAGGPVGAGSVTFYDGATSIGATSVVSGVATLTTTTLAQGLHTLTAQYGGAPGYGASASGVVSEFISKPVAAVAVGTSGSPSALSQSVTFTATLTGGSGTPTGSVAFLDGASLLANVALSGGVATYTTSVLTGGAHTINVAYSGNATYGTSSGFVLQVVALPTITPSGPTTFCAGGSVTLTASIAPGDPGVSFFQWSTGETTQAIVASASGSYSFNVIVNGVAGASAPTVVTANPLPATPVITAPSRVASGATGFIVSAPAHAGSTYLWTITNGTFTTANGSNEITFTAGVDGPLGLTVVETNADGCVSAPGAAAITVGPAATSFWVLAPCRLLDTRLASGPSAGAPALASGEVRTVAIAGRCGLPASAKSISVNLTAVPGASAGSLVIYPAATAVPVGTTVFFNSGQVRAVNGIVLLAVDGSDVKIENDSAGASNVVVDVNGWFE